MICLLLVFFLLLTTQACLSETCLHKLNLESETDEDIKLFGECTFKVLVERGYKPCNAECFEKLNEQEKGKHIGNIARLTRQLVDEEIERRKSINKI